MEKKKRKSFILRYATQFPWHLEQMDIYEATETDYKNPKELCGFPSALQQWEFSIKS